MADPWDEARKVLERKGAVAAKVGDDLLNAYRHGIPAQAAYIVKDLDTADIDMKMLVIGHILGVAVRAEEQIKKLTPGLGEVDISTVPWAVSVYDQMQAAAEAGDVRLLASMALDATLRGGAVDVPEGELSHQQAYVYISDMDPGLLRIFAAEAVRRLFNEGRQRDGTGTQ